jgi:hypothetical protein
MLGDRAVVVGTPLAYMALKLVVRDSSRPRVALFSRLLEALGTDLAVKGAYGNDLFIAREVALSV